jgi:hypothetical protein
MSGRSRGFRKTRPRIAEHQQFEKGEQSMRLITRTVQIAIALLAGPVGVFLVTTAAHAGENFGG